MPAERATKKLEKEFAPREQELRKMDQQIKSLQGQLEKDGLTMSETDRRNKEQELGRQTREFQRLQREFREDLNLRRNEELAALFERANKVIRQIAEIGEIRSDHPGSGLPQPAHRYYREGSQSARRGQIAFAGMHHWCTGESRAGK